MPIKEYINEFERQKLSKYAILKEKKIYSRM